MVSFRTRVGGRKLWMLASVLVGACGAVALATPSVVHAENSIVSSTPEDGAELTSAPTELVTTFENEIGTSSAVMVCDNDPFTGIDGAGTQVSADRKTVTLPLTQTPEGECVVTFALTNAEGEEDGTASFGFTVAEGASAAPSGATTAEGGTTAAAADVAGDTGESSDSSDVADASTVSSAPIWLGSLLSILGLAVLFGSLVLIVAAWPEGPEYVLALRFLRSAWIVGLVGTVIYVIALSAAVKDKSIGSGVSPGAWIDLFDAGWRGRAAVLRLVLAAACGWVVLKPERVIDPTTNMLALGVPALAVVTLGLSRTGGSLAFLGVVASIIHVLAMAVWLGGVVLLARVVLAGPGEEDLVHAVRGFSRISNPAIIGTVVSGLIQLYRQVGGELFTTGHGRVLLLKTAAVAGMLFVGLTARQIARAKLNRAGELSIKTADRLRRAFGTEAAIGLIVIALTGWLLALDPGKVDDDGGGAFDVRDEISLDAPAFELSVSVDPGRIGLNDLRVIVREPASGLSNLRLRFRPPEGSTAGTAFEQAIGLTTSGIAESGEGGGIPFDVAGRWQVEVVATTSEGDVPATVMFLDIADENGDMPPIGNNLPDTPNIAATTQPPVATVTDSAVETTEG